MQNNGNPKFEAWLEVEAWLRNEADKYDEASRAMPGDLGLDGVAHGIRNMLTGMANKASREATKAGVGR